ncbi:hypothetical protein PR003_g18866 [Phytophthora rubi]|uniref:Uncharacterized protein n=1 Tax=Phytophthora rubi TaxID=129364 RepID=A0A6A4E2G3_9STRA|nr:hypothetical protein PR003_g18866 [Phytophthora rubi]
MVVGVPYDSKIVGVFYTPNSALDNLQLSMQFTGLSDALFGQTASYF